MIVKEVDPEESNEEKTKKKKDSDAGGKIYKFCCQTDEEKRKWVTAITDEMRRKK